MPWYHPRQTWFVMAHSAEALPPLLEDANLSDKLGFDVRTEPDRGLRRLRNGLVRRMKALLK